MPVAMWIVGAVVRVVIRFRRRGQKTVLFTLKESLRCRCGYTLTNLDRIRCPECGRVFGFDATPEELGLSDDELRKATEVREQRRQHSST